MDGWAGCKSYPLGAMALAAMHQEEVRDV
jgi:hypothetical protein